jgi:hypothetical protein
MIVDPKTFSLKQGDLIAEATGGTARSNPTKPLPKMPCKVERKAI